MRNIAWIITTGILLCIRTSAVNADEMAVAPPQGSSLLLEVMADGVQIYSCRAKGNGFEWSFTAPEANLFDQQGRQIGTHFAGPSWKLTDGSEVVGEVVAKADAPDAGAIQWLLLRAKSHEGSGMLAQAAFIRRAETKDGLAPRSGCDANHLAQQTRMRYSATYQFFGAEKGR